MPDKVNIGKTARIILSNNQLVPRLLAELIKIMDRKNAIYINTHLKKTIAQKLNIKILRNVDLMISRYVQQDYMLKFAESSYLLNPTVAFKCSNLEFMAICNRYDEIKEAQRQTKRRRKENKSLPDTKNIYFINEPKVKYGD